MRRIDLYVPIWIPAVADCLNHYFWFHSPREMCGVVWQNSDGDYGFEVGKNVSENSHESSFEIAPQTILDWCQRATHDQKTLLAWVHSHPAGKPSASLADRNFWWANGTWLWPGMDQAILWSDETKMLNLSVFGPHTNKNRPSPKWQGPLNA